MGRASSSKKVAKAAAAGRRSRVAKERSLGFPAVIVGVVVVGVGFVVAADRDQADADDTPPLAGIDHWHTAFGIYYCGSYLPNQTDQNDPVGIHTHGDGVIHIHPFLSKAAGKNARLDDYFEAAGLEVSDDRVETPEGDGGADFRDGDDCAGTPGELRLLVWDAPDDAEPDVVTSDFGSVRFTQDRQVMALVLAPPDADIPKPDSVPTLDNLSDLAEPLPEEPNDGDLTDPGDPTETTVVGDTSTTVAGDTATTVAGATATTVAGDTSTTAPAPEESTTTTTAG